MMNRPYNAGMQNRRALLWAVPVVLAAGLLIAGWRLMPRLVEISPAPGSQNVAPTAAIRLAFSQPMDAASVEARLSLDPENPGRFTWEDAQTLVFTPDTVWERGTTIAVRLAAGARSTLRLPLAGEAGWTFETRRVQLAYLWPADAPAQLYALDTESGEVARLTDGPAIFDFSPAADGETIYYAARNRLGGSDLYALERASGVARQILNCGADLCSDVQAAPGGEWLAYTRLPFQPEPVSTRLEIWLLEIARGETRRVSAEGEQPRLPLWSPLDRLIYYDAQTAAYVLISPASDEVIRFANGAGEQGTWTPDGQTFIAPELFVQLTTTLQGPIGELANQPPDPANQDRVQVYSSRLLAYGLDGSITDLTLSPTLEDAHPAVSPDGLWLAYARRYLDEERFTTGRQLWLARLDGSNPRQLTHSPQEKHASLVWHPAGDWLALVRFNATVFTLPPEILLLQPSSGEIIQLVSNAYSPQWLP